ncbi:hypothetical protein IMAU70164_02979 [Lactiplantibacillus plantarum]|uniref:hypothetical protein n=1 Tax=Lactiplantibacillus plantarum TaxID=1590 RepID=UPI0021A3158B|nr:hypothetical protein [Lactiplantibacillus plantarum]MCG0798625.1 hypothetical protein [Lactiplantibacillus plantarum]
MNKWASVIKKIGETNLLLSNVTARLITYMGVGSMIVGLYDFAGDPIAVNIDLASKRDEVDLVLVFMGVYAVIFFGLNTYLVLLQNKMEGTNNKRSAIGTFAVIGIPLLIVAFPFLSQNIKGLNDESFAIIRVAAAIAIGFGLFSLLQVIKEALRYLSSNIKDGKDRLTILIGFFGTLISLIALFK